MGPIGNEDMANINGNINQVDQHVGQMIRLHRKAAGVGQIELSARLGIPHRKLQKFERGSDRVSPKLLRNICISLGIRPIALFETMGLAVPARHTRRPRRYSIG